VPTLGGFVVVLILLLFATQVAFDLYARSAVTAAAVDAAHAVADYRGAVSGSGQPADTAADGEVVRAAESRARYALGGYGRVTSFRWSLLPSADDPRDVVLTVRFDLRGTRYSLVRPLSLPGLNQFQRTVRIRVDRPVCPAGATCTVVSASAPRTGP